MKTIRINYWEEIPDNFTGVVEYTRGYKAVAWYQNGKKHKKNGPAVEWENGTKLWYQYGKIHRADGPAVEYTDGRKNKYFINGERTYKEAVEVYAMLFPKKEQE
jgi:hypothetical protein